jgi:hypothetical protein
VEPGKEEVHPDELIDAVKTGVAGCDHRCGRGGLDIAPPSKHVAFLRDLYRG